MKPKICTDWKHFPVRNFKCDWEIITICTNVKFHGLQMKSNAHVAFYDATSMPTLCKMEPFCQLLRATATYFRQGTQLRHWLSTTVSTTLYFVKSRSLPGVRYQSLYYKRFSIWDALTKHIRWMVDLSVIQFEQDSSKVISRSFSRMMPKPLAIGHRPF